MSPPQGNYTVSIVATDGQVVASATTAGMPGTLCGGGTAANVPLPVSTSDSRLYFLDGQGVVEYLTPDGKTGQAATVPTATAARRSMFAVSPDDRRIAVVVADFNSTGASTRLYVEDLGGTNHAEIFSETGSYTLWPIGWHGTDNLVLAKVLSCSQGSGAFCCGPLELHVVDPATAARRFTLGGPGCVVVGPPSPAGVACESPDFINLEGINWTAGVFVQYAIQFAVPGYMSPDGKSIAMAGHGVPPYPGGNPNTTSLNTKLAGIYSFGDFSMVACGWIDDSHLLAGGDAQNQPRIGDTNSGKITPVAAYGECGGRIPGGL